MSSFWQTLPKPFTVLAPLDGVTDTVFRQVITEVGKPDVLFTEFTACGGLVSSGHDHTAENFIYTKEQKPIVAQIWGTNPKDFYTVAKEVQARGFDGIDINMGCPIRAITKDGSCSALIKTPELAGKLIQALKDGAPHTPISVKTRIGVGTPQIKEWIGFLLKQDLAALTVHLRTVSEMSKVPAHWEMMKQVIALRDELAPQTVIIGNGDITNLAEIKEKHTVYGCEGFMVGRGIFANPWLFNSEVNMHEKTVPERIALYLRHIELFEKQWQGSRRFDPLKKFAKVYISNFADASSFRENLMQAKTIEELRQKLEEYNG